MSKKTWSMLKEYFEKKKETFQHLKPVIILK